ncbi:MAG: NADH-quinone oxidoreductase subunit J [Fidelibacterota bacterium]|nr:MAG: NADH-quinone oxidoreductase subunit J [Candidatus Neomarinimicrobiota bacterium]
MGNVVFIGVAVLVVVSAFFVVTARNLVYSAVALMGTLFGVAGLYVFLYADFMAAVQIVIYVGGILVLIIFGVMLTNKIATPVLIQTSMPNRALAAVVVFLIFLGLTTLLFRTPWHEGATVAPEGTVATIGQALLTKYLIHFEVAGVLLLLALLGAAYLSRRENG